MEQVVPFDVIPHILSKLPVKTLMKFKSVCKHWSNLIDSPFFAHLHSSQAIQETRVLLPSSSSSDGQQKCLKPCKDDGRFMHISLDLVSKFFESKSYYLVGSCNGLLCFKKKSYCDIDRRTGGLLLFNPLRQQLLPLPPPSAESVSMRQFGFGFDSSTATYKMLSVFYNEISTNFDDEPRYSLGAEVFTIGRSLSSSSSSSSWRAISNVPQLLPVLQDPVFLWGAIYWVTHPLNITPETSYNSKKIVAFHLGNEEFSLIAWPSTVGFHDMCHLVELRGCLCIAYYCSKDYIDIWMMKENKRKAEECWVNEYRIHIKTPSASEIFYYPKIFVEVIGQWEDEEILLRYCSSFVAYNPRTDKLSCINIRSPDEVFVFCYTFTGSLISFSGFQAAEEINSLVEA
nr:F-box protein At3g07870-like [Ziziphus jujuba var. spinosa]